MMLRVESQAVLVFVFLATSATAMILDEMSSPPVVASGALLESGAPEGHLGENSYQDGQSENVYHTYSVRKPYSTFYSGSSSNLYGGAAPDSGNSNNDYTASSSYQTGDQAPHYVSSFRRYPNMAVAKPYTYYIAHRGDASGAPSIARNEGQPEVDSSNGDHYQNGKPVATAKRSLLEMLQTSHESRPASAQLSSFITSNSAENARVQLSFSGGYTYLTFIIPGDICTLNQQEAAGSSTLLGSLGGSSTLLGGLGGSSTSLGGLGGSTTLLGSQANSYINQQIPYRSPINSFPVSAGEYGTESHYQYGGAASQSQATYSNGQTMYETMPETSQNYALNEGVNGAVVGAGGASFLSSIAQNIPALRGLGDLDQSADEQKPPQSSPAPASANSQPNTASVYSPASRSISQ